MMILNLTPKIKCRDEILTKLALCDESKPLIFYGSSGIGKKYFASVFSKYNPNLIPIVIDSIIPPNIFGQLLYFRKYTETELEKFIDPQIDFKKFKIPILKLSYGSTQDLHDYMYSSFIDIRKLFLRLLTDSLRYVSIHKCIQDIIQSAADLPINLTLRILYSLCNDVVYAKNNITSKIIHVDCVDLITKIPYEKALNILTFKYNNKISLDLKDALVTLFILYEN